MKKDTLMNEPILFGRAYEVSPIPFEQWDKGLSRVPKQIRAQLDSLTGDRGIHRPLSVLQGVACDVSDQVLNRCSEMIPLGLIPLL
jgi:Ni,Fe-hydrogenase III large subunit